MLTLLIDTSHSILAVGLMNDEGLIDAIQETLKKKHSERLVCAVEALLKRNHVDKKDLGQVCVTDGPGSYTGMRIGLTFAKVLSLSLGVRVYVIDTLLSLSGYQSGFAFIDARSGRVFGALVDSGRVQDERVYTLDELKTIDAEFYGDVGLIGQEQPYPDVCQNMADLKAYWIHCETVDALAPRYLT